MRLSSALAVTSPIRNSPVSSSGAEAGSGFGDLNVDDINRNLKKGWTAHVNCDGRIYYCNHGTQTASWLPPNENWTSGSSGLPYGWEAAIDKDGKSYFINHVNKTSTYEDPRKEVVDPPPQPREVELRRDPELGFGFVAGSEKPVVVRFVTDGGPSVDKLLPGDQILKINGEEVRRAPREHVIELVRSCKHSVCLTVCQPHTTNSARKSAILSAAKKAKLKTHPSRVRFAEGVVINGSPLVSPSSYSTSESCIPFMPNVLKVFLENGQTKSFKYDGSTTIGDVIESLQQKLSIKSIEHFSLVVEHIKSLRRNKLTLLDPAESLARIAARPGAQHLRCLFRITFVPKDAYDLLRIDPVSFEYLYVQCCNDVVHERFAPELKYDIALRLAALHIQQHALTNNLQGKLSVKSIEREFGLERFVPLSLVETMKRKELRKLLSHFLKLNQNLSAPGQKCLSALQAKLHYLKIVAELPSYGAKCYTTATLRDSTTETIILVSPKFGVSQISGMRNSTPLTLAEIEDISVVFVIREDELCHRVEIQLKDPQAQNIVLNLEDRDAEELVLLLQGYYHLLTDKELPVHQEKDRWAEDAAPPYHTQHRVQTDDWNYIDSGKEKTVDLSTAPTYKPSTQKTLTANGHVGTMAATENDGNKLDSSTKTKAIVDNNMNKMNNGSGKTPPPIPPPRGDVNLNTKAKFNATSGIDWDEKEKGERKDVIEAKNDEVIRRVAEMQQIVHSAENYLTGRNVQPDQIPRVEMLAEQLPKLRAADSLLLLTQVGRESELEAIGKLEVQDEPSGSDTDSISTPTDSPSHRSEQQRKIMKRPNGSLIGSSFGLHSPDNLPLAMHKANLQDLVKKLQSENQLPYPFAEGTLYLDPDIIDLTMIPPPMTPDREGMDLPFAVSMPPTPFADRGSLEAELRALEAHFYQEAFALQKDIAEQTKMKNGNVAITVNAATPPNSLASTEGSSPPPPPKGWGSGDIDNFIASVSVPPPPSEEQLAALNFPIHSPVVELTPEDISAFIIPPPPASSSSESDCEMIARLQEAADSINEVMGAPGTTPGVRRKPIGQKAFQLQAPPPRPFQRRLASDFQGDSSGYETQASSIVSCDARDLPECSVDDAFGKTQADDASTISGGSSGTHGDAEDEGVESELPKSFYFAVQRQESNANEGTESNDGGRNGMGSPFTRQMSMPRSHVPPSRCINKDEKVDTMFMLNEPVDSKSTLKGTQKPPPHPSSPSVKPCRPALPSSPIVEAKTFSSANGRHPPIVPKPVLPKSPSHSPKRPPPKPPVNMNGQSDHLRSIPSVSKDSEAFEITMNGLDNEITTEVYSFVLPQEENDLMQMLGTEEPLQKAESLVGEMVSRLDEILDGCAKGDLISADRNKLVMARDSLVTEARRFVTASKLFVKSIAEGEAKLTSNLGVCVALLERMLKVTEILAANTLSPIQTQNVTLKVRDVAATYVQTTRAAAVAMGKAINDPDMNVLMQQATTLAAVLTALMRTLRAFNP